jgi:hypothetical protein
MMYGRLVLLTLASSVCLAASSPDLPPNPTLSEWFKNLRQPATNALCCSISDCHRVDYRLTDGGYEVYAEGRWYQVPNNIILRQKGNPVGKAVACYTTILGYATLPGVSGRDREDRVEILCFVPELPTS